MAKSRPTVTKRIREKAKMEKRQRKAERKAQRAAEELEEGGAEAEEGVDPDLAGIIPGPQKPLW